MLLSNSTCAATAGAARMWANPPTAPSPSSSISRRNEPVRCDGAYLGGGDEGAGTVAGRPVAAQQVARRPVGA
jgi:hypothetical protein